MYINKVYNFLLLSEMALVILYLLMNWFDIEFGVNWVFLQWPLFNVSLG